MSWDCISTGTTISTARRKSPACSAHRAARWNKTTLPAMMTFRLTPGKEGVGTDRVMVDGVGCFPVAKYRSTVFTATCEKPTRPIR